MYHSLSKRFERTLHQGGQMANKQVERSLASLIIREMQIKTMKRYQDTLQWLKLRRLTLPSVGVLGSWSGNLKWHNHFETVWLGLFFFKLNIHLSYKPVIPLLGIYLPKRNESICSQQDLKSVV